MSIRDDSHPYLVLANDEGAFAWNTGFMYALMLESTFMRINSRGIRCATVGMHRLHPRRNK